MTRRVLLTGGNGLIGRPCVHALQARGFKVIATSRTGNVACADETIKCDLLDDDSRRAAITAARATHLVHLAWFDAPGARWQSRQNFDWVMATLSLVQEFAKNGGRRVVAVGSCAEYDWSNAVFSENSALKPRTRYGEAKMQTGQKLLGLADQMGLSLAWARVFFCFGPNEPKGRLLGDLLAGLTNSVEVPCSDGLQERDFLHSFDVADALATLADGDLDGAVNVASGAATPVREIILKTADMMHRRDLVRLGALKRPADDPACLVANVTRLASTGFRPTFDIESGLAQVIGEMERHK